HHFWFHALLSLRLYRRPGSVLRRAVRRWLPTSMARSANARGAKGVSMRGLLSVAVTCVAHDDGFHPSMVAELVGRGLASMTQEKVRAGGGLVEVVTIRITEAGRDALRAARG